MAILDDQLQFCSAMALSDGVDSTNVLDMSVANRRLGSGETLYVVVNVTTVMSAVAVTVVLRNDAAATMDTPATDVATLGTLAASSIVGTKLIAAIPANMITLRYVDLEFNGAATGAVDAHLLLGPPDDFEYADGLTITG